MGGDLGLRPFNARSLALSVLLGLDPPVLPVRSLVALAEQFGIAEGTMRTALSRMVAGGEVASDGDGYRLVGRLLARKEAQDMGRRPPTERWNGDWWLAVVTKPRRNVAERRSFRTHMANVRMGELRPETWMRPTNLDGPVAGDGLVVVRGPLRGEDHGALAGHLWPLDDLASNARRLVDDLDDASPDESLPAAITLSAAVVRFLRSEPLLPSSLTPQPWPPDELRTRYRDHDRALGRALARVRYD